jgi:ATP-dependent Clp protease ATP-binding subunit ClpA
MLIKFYFALSVVQLVKNTKEDCWKIKFGLTYGARPAKPVLQRYVENKLAKDILQDEFKDEETFS